MRYTENALNVLTLKSFKGIGNAWIHKNYNPNDDLEKVLFKLNASIKNDFISEQKFYNLRMDYEKRILEKFKHCCDGFVAFGDFDFPACRGIVKDSEQPVFLYYKGDIKLLRSENWNVTVIGLLNPDESIEQRERAIVSKLVEKGATIVSGLALGCDSIAHKQALDSKGKTIAILPSPLDTILPKSNHNLAHIIVSEGGLLITEYGNNFKSQMELSTRYKERDRLQALFCDTIILAASYAKDSASRWNINDKKLDSGARLAMGFAKSYGIPRAVMYDNFADTVNPMFDLNRDIVAEEKGVTILDLHNYVDAINKFILPFSRKNSNPLFSKNLFD